MKRSKKKPPIHSSIKDRLGYEKDATDDEVYADWKLRTSRVCKPCWELKYCPYGPLVEQSPLLPSLLSESKEHNEYLKGCIETNLIGQLTELTPELRSYYREWMNDPDVLIQQSITEMEQQEYFESVSNEANDDDFGWRNGPLPPPHIYRAEFDIDFEREVDESDFEPEVWEKILARASELKEKYSAALKTGKIDNRRPLEPIRRKWLSRMLENFSPDDHPESIPQVFIEGQCNVFGHICPVFFAAQATTESGKARRIGRHHLSFTSMMRIVRRDDYRCQHCMKKLRDDEVEFDHIIPVSKGGSSEEHNLRLTCFDCNRDKSDDYHP